MAVVRNLMIRIGADYSAAKKGMDGATRSLDRFKRDTEKSANDINGRRGLGGVTREIRNLSSTVSDAFSRIRGAKGVGGVISELGSMTPAIGAAVTGLRGLGGAAVGAGASLGAAGLAVGGFVAVLGLATVGIYQASQAAVKFEADLGRLNMQLKGGAKDFMSWARAQGLAKSTSAELGATYGTLLSSFISDNKKLQGSTKELVQATRITASATGRSIEDVLERMRSGLLGNTEAIEDLGIFVNIAMIESTKAFKQFANGKSWDQLDFRVQQQIRLAAILEQTYSRYGSSLQQNVMSKQTLLMEQLKDVKLNLSQAFLPIWDAILPALTKLAEGLAVVTEGIARMMYMLRGWDYDERTQGSDEEAKAVENLGDSYEKTGKQAAKARSELAAFDRLNLLGSGSGGGGGGGGTGGGGSGGGGTGGNGSGDGWGGIPPYPPELKKKWRIEFDTPHPPDAGLGAVATAVVSTVNEMIAQVKARLAKMWADLSLQTQQALAGQLGQLGAFAGNLNGILMPGLSSGVVTQWSEMWRQLGAITGVNVPALQGQISTFFQSIGATTTATTAQIARDWKAMLSGMLTAAVNQVPPISAEWEKLKLKVASLALPLANVRIDWKNMLTHFLDRLKEFQPSISLGWQTIQQSILDTVPFLSVVESAWDLALKGMKETTVNIVNTIVGKVGELIGAWQGLMGTLGVGAPASGKSGGWSFGDTLSNAFSKETLTRMKDFILGEAAKPENQAGAAVVGTMIPAGRLAGLADDLAKLIGNLFKGGGGAIPAFASGGLVYGPTLSMVGDNHNAASDPEVIAPLSKLESLIDGPNNAEIVSLLRSIHTAIRESKTVQAVISRDEIGRSAVEYNNDVTRRTGVSPLHI